MQSLRASLTECDSKLNELRGQRSEIEHQLAALKKDLADAEADELKWRFGCWLNIPRLLFFILHFILLFFKLSRFTFATTLAVY